MRGSKAKTKKSSGLISGNFQLRVQSKLKPLGKGPFALLRLEHSSSLDSWLSFMVSLSMLELMSDFGVTVPQKRAVASVLKRMHEIGVERSWIQAITLDLRWSHR